MADWHYAQGDQQLGPVPQAQLMHMLQSGQLPYTTLVWTAGMRDWAPASSITGLMAAPSPPHGAPASPIPTMPQPIMAFAGYAGFWKRFVALIVDTVILIGLSMLVAMPFAVLLFLAGVEETVLEPIMNILGALIAWLYGAGFESSQWQATPGKRLLGIMVTDLDGKPISFLRATGRHFAKIISAFLLLIGYIMAGFTPRKQGLHDMIAGCLVINRP